MIKNKQYITIKRMILVLNKLIYIIMSFIKPYPIKNLNTNIIMKHEYSIKERENESIKLLYELSIEKTLEEIKKQKYGDKEKRSIKELYDFQI